MRKREMLLASAFLAIATTGSSQRNAKAEACFSLGSHVEARACLEARFKATDVVLREQEVACDKAISTWDEAAEVRKRTKSAFADTGRAFRQYRSAQCDLQAVLAAGGTGAQDRRLMCAIELNEQRINYLQEIRTSIGAPR